MWSLVNKRIAANKPILCNKRINVLSILKYYLLSACTYQQVCTLAAMHIHVAHSCNMATVQEALLQRGDHPKKRRKSYSREFKLDIAKFYRRIYQTARRFSLITKTVLQWVKDEDVIKESKKGSNHKQLRRLPLYPEIEERLYHEYKNLRKKRIKVKGYWFRICAKNILEETSPPPPPKKSFMFVKFLVQRL